MIFQAKRLKIWLLALAIAGGLFFPKAHALDRKRSSGLSYYIMGVLYDDLGDIDKAVEEYKKALRVDSENSVIHLSLAASYIKKNNFDKALNELNTVVKLDPESSEPHAILALLYSLQNKPEYANREYEIALKNASKLHPKDIEIYKDLGALYLGQKNYFAAENVFRLILNLEPNFAPAHFYLAFIYEQKGDKGKTEEELKKALKLKADYQEALNYLGYFYVEENKNLGLAEKLIKHALEIEPDNGAYVDSLGWLYFKKGKLKRALELITRASLLLEDPVIYDHLGDVYFKLADINKAKMSWENSLRLDPKQEQVRKKIENLNKPK